MNMIGDENILDEMWNKIATRRIQLLCIYDDWIRRLNYARPLIR